MPPTSVNRSKIKVSKISQSFYSGLHFLPSKLGWNKTLFKKFLSKQHPQLVASMKLHVRSILRWRIHCRNKIRLRLIDWYDWFNWDDNIRNSDSVSIFKSKPLSFIHQVQSNICNIFEPKWIKFLTH